MKTLILTDLIENITDNTANSNWVLKLWCKAVFHMWNHPQAAPEYRMGWKDKAAARTCLLKILDWDFEKIILAHGDLVHSGGQAFARKAWQVPLRDTA